VRGERSLNALLREAHHPLALLEREVEKYLPFAKEKKAHERHQCTCFR
jgi:hypothetical protein